ncbi:hypothetical protein CKO28_13330 [Rhodovibrio sodomensis]|uniref:Uncharacterized protein n=1 Tax=Rhodovibrio sodomensis TaxID=1088 RepID=A0ABS1DFK4_9PROT|nr:hypothetical protein [Rhodovibrio sodomensis]MBK1669014.1 hypothetical protein [Rhodovibrio sodomensis]
MHSAWTKNLACAALAVGAAFAPSVAVSDGAIPPPASQGSSGQENAQPETTASKEIRAWKRAASELQIGKRVMSNIVSAQDYECADAFAEEFGGFRFLSAGRVWLRDKFERESDHEWLATTSPNLLHAQSPANGLTMKSASGNPSSVFMAPRFADPQTLAPDSPLAGGLQPTLEGPGGFKGYLAERLAASSDRLRAPVFVYNVFIEETADHGGGLFDKLFSGPSKAEGVRYGRAVYLAKAPEPRKGVSCDQLAAAFRARTVGTMAELNAFKASMSEKFPKAWSDRLPSGAVKLMKRRQYQIANSTPVPPEVASMIDKPDLTASASKKVVSMFGGDLVYPETHLRLDRSGVGSITTYIEANSADDGLSGKYEPRDGSGYYATGIVSVLAPDGIRYPVARNGRGVDRNTVISQSHQELLNPSLVGNDIIRWKEVVEEDAWERGKGDGTLYTMKTVEFEVDKIEHTMKRMVFRQLQTTRLKEAFPNRYPFEWDQIGFMKKAAYRSCRRPNDQICVFDWKFYVVPDGPRDPNMEPFVSGRVRYAFESVAAGFISAVPVGVRIYEINPVR